MATRISNTYARIEIKNITVSKEKAFVTFLVFANKLETTNKSYQFYIEDFDKDNKSKGFKLLSRNFYWLNFFNKGLTTDSNTVDFKLYKELTFEVDITNFNSSEIKNNRWVRPVKFRLYNTQTKKYDFVSDKYDLISDEILVPEIQGVRIYSLDVDKTDPDLEKIVVELKFKYESQYDFNYTNTNIEYILQLVSPQTTKVIDSVILKENDVNDMNDEIGVIRYTFQGKFNNILYVRTAIRMVNGNIVVDKKTLYKPLQARNPVFIKQANGEIKQVVSSFSKKVAD
jgi:hypothetical protein